MLLLIRKILRKAKTGVIWNRKIVPEKSNIKILTLKIVNDPIPSSSSSSDVLELKEIKPLIQLKRQCTIKELDESLAELRNTIKKLPTPTYHRFSYTPPQLYQNETKPFENEFSGNASSTVSEEEEEEYIPVKPRNKSAAVIRRMTSSKQKRFSSPPIRSLDAPSIERCFSQNSERFQFRLSQNLLPSIPIEEDALSITETMSLTTPLPNPMQPIISCYY